MIFKELLEKKNITGYALSKNTGIPYTTINDLINGKTVIQNISLKHAVAISECLDVDLLSLNKLETMSFPDFRYFRNNVLHDLKRLGPKDFVYKITREKLIDYYYKNDGKPYAYYLLALIDYLCNLFQIPKYERRYNELRLEKLEHPFFVGSKIINFNSIEEAEKELKMKVIPEFKKFNIIEVEVFNVA